MTSGDLTILIVSYDGYMDMWPMFFKCMHDNWTDCPYEVVLANNEASFEFDKVRVIHCGKDAQWSTRTRKALESISSKYVCFLLEDFFISKTVKTNEIKDVLQTMDSYSVKYYKLMSLSKIKTQYFNKERGERIIPSNLKYGISLLAAIWDRNYFLDLIGKEDYNPWRFEIDRNNEAEVADDTVYGIYNERNLLNICHMVVQGKYLPSSLKKMKNNGYNIPFEARGVHSCFFEIKNRLKDVIYPIFRKSSFLMKMASFLGFETITNKNK